MILYLLICVNSIFAQHKINFSFNQPPLLEVDAGNDTIADLNTTIQLGGDLVAWGGTNDYTFSWEPALLLDDNSIAHPTTSLNVDTTFYLTATDGRGCSASDEIKISRSSLGNFNYDYAIKDIVLSPNPAKEKIAIDVISVSKSINCIAYVINTSGDLLLQQSYVIGPGNTSEHFISISDIPNGCYYLRIVGNQIDISKPFIKN